MLTGLMAHIPVSTGSCALVRLEATTIVMETQKVAILVNLAGHKRERLPETGAA
jgi:hypothetical protein